MERTFYVCQETLIVVGIMLRIRSSVNIPTIIKQQEHIQNIRNLYPFLGDFCSSVFQGIYKENVIVIVIV